MCLIFVIVLIEYCTLYQPILSVLDAHGSTFRNDLGFATKFYGGGKRSNVTLEATMRYSSGSPIDNYNIGGSWDFYTLNLLFHWNWNTAAGQIWGNHIAIKNRLSEEFWINPLLLKTVLVLFSYSIPLLLAFKRSQYFCSTSGKPHSTLFI